MFNTCGEVQILLLCLSASSVSVADLLSNITVVMQHKKCNNNKNPRHSNNPQIVKKEV